MGVGWSGGAGGGGVAAGTGDAEVGGAGVGCAEGGGCFNGARDSAAGCDVWVSGDGAAKVLEHFDLTIAAGSSLAIVGQNGAGKTTIAKLLCRLYDPQSGAIEIDGVDLRELDLESWRARVTAVFQDFIRLELPLRDNVAPAGRRRMSYCGGAGVGGGGESGGAGSRCWRAGMRAARIFLAGSGSGWRWRGRWRGGAGCGSGAAG